MVQLAKLKAQQLKLAFL